MFTKLLTTTAPVGDLVARYMTPEYLESHRPVFSSKTFHHVTFVSPSELLPGGQRLVCPGKCKAILKSQIIYSKKRKTARVTCTGCYRKVKVLLPKIGYSIHASMRDLIFHVPGRTIVQTPYPIPLATHFIWSPPSEKPMDLDIEAKTHSEVTNAFTDVSKPSEPLIEGAGQHPLPADSPITTHSETRLEPGGTTPKNSSIGRIRIPPLPRTTTKGKGPSQQSQPPQLEKRKSKSLLIPPLTTSRSVDEEYRDGQTTVGGTLGPFSTTRANLQPRLLPFISQANIDRQIRRLVISL